MSGAGASAVLRSVAASARNTARRIDPLKKQVVEGVNKGVAIAKDRFVPTALAQVAATAAATAATAATSTRDEVAASGDRSTGPSAANGEAGDSPPSTTTNELPPAVTSGLQEMFEKLLVDAHRRSGGVDSRLAPSEDEKKTAADAATKATRFVGDLLATFWKFNAASAIKSAITMKGAAGYKTSYDFPLYAVLMNKAVETAQPRNSLEDAEAKDVAKDIAMAVALVALANVGRAAIMGSIPSLTVQQVVTWYTAFVGGSIASRAGTAVASLIDEFSAFTDTVASMAPIQLPASAPTPTQKGRMDRRDVDIAHLLRDLQRTQTALQQQAVLLHREGETQNALQQQPVNSHREGGTRRRSRLGRARAVAWAWRSKARTKSPSRRSARRRRRRARSRRATHQK